MRHPTARAGRRTGRRVFCLTLLALLLGAGLARQTLGAAATAALAAPIARAAAADLADGLQRHRIVVLGEMHGTHEAPALAGELARTRLDRDATGVTLALEIHGAEQARIDAFLASAGSPAAREALLSGAFWARPAAQSDGRRSVAMLALLETARRLRASGNDLRVLAFDPGSAGGDADARNRRIAAALRQAFERDRGRSFIVLIGNYHARRRMPTQRMGGLAAGQRPPMPTMAHLADVPLHVIRVEAERGAFWGCPSPGSCGPLPYRGPPRTGSSLPAVDWTPGPDAAWDARVLLPRYTAAPPAGRASPP